MLRDVALAHSPVQEESSESLGLLRRVGSPDSSVGLPEQKRHAVPVYSHPHALKTSKSTRIAPFKTSNQKLSIEIDCRDVRASPERSRSPNRLPDICQTLLMSPASSPTSFRASGARSPTKRGMSQSSGSGMISSHSSHTPSPATERSGVQSPTRCWSPTKRVPMPPTLGFDSWWNEKGQRIVVAVIYDTQAQICTASLHVSVDSRVTPRFSQAAIEPWDLHVGAKVRLLGRLLTLRKARDTATIDWLDQQAVQLNRQIVQLQQALSKYRVVACATALAGPRNLHMDPRSHTPIPSGGHTNLRALRSEVLQLSQALRQFQLTLPSLSPGQGAACTRTLSADLQGPSDWAPERRQALAEAQRVEEEAKAKREAELAAAEASKNARKDLVEYLINIPLAASAANLERKNNKYVDPVKTAEVAAAEARDMQSRGSGVRRSSALALDMNVWTKMRASPELRSASNAATPLPIMATEPRPPRMQRQVTEEHADPVHSTQQQISRHPDPAMAPDYPEGTQSQSRPPSQAPSHLVPSMRGEREDVVVTPAETLVFSPEALAELKARSLGMVPGDERPNTVDDPLAQASEGSLHGPSLHGPHDEANAQDHTGNPREEAEGDEEPVVDTAGSMGQPEAAQLPGVEPPVDENEAARDSSPSSPLMSGDHEPVTEAAEEDHHEPVTGAAEEDHEPVTGAAEEDHEPVTGAAEEDHEPVTGAAEEDHEPVTEAAEEDHEPVTEAAEEDHEPVTGAAEEDHKPVTEAAEEDHEPVTGAAEEDHEPVTGEAGESPVEEPADSTYSDTFDKVSEPVPEKDAGTALTEVSQDTSASTDQVQTSEGAGSAYSDAFEAASNNGHPAAQENGVGNAAPGDSQAAPEGAVHDMPADELHEAPADAVHGECSVHEDS